MTGCAAASSDAAPAAAGTTQAPKELTPQEKADAFLQTPAAMTPFMMDPEFSDLHGGPANSQGVQDVSNSAAVNAMDLLGLMYAGFPEHQKASFVWNEEEVQKVSDAFAPHVYGSFLGQITDGLREHEGGLVLTTASTLTSGANPRVYTHEDGTTCALTDDPWDVQLNDRYLYVGPDVSPASGETLRTIRLDYSTTFTIKCVDGKTMTVSQPKHLGFVDNAGAWQLYEYGRDGYIAVEFQPAP